MILGNKVSVFGGTGFVGREVVNELSKVGYEVTLLVRRPERYRDFSLYSNTVVRALSSYDAEPLTAALAGTDIIVNLIADRSTGTERIEPSELVHVNQKIKAASEIADVKRVLSLSQIGASGDEKGRDWLGLLAEADDLMQAVSCANVTIFKPSLLIGENDDTTVRFAKQLQRMSLLMVANVNTVVQPVWIKDFALAFVGSIRNPATFGQKLEVSGEERMTLKELGQLVAEIMQKEAIVFPMCRLNATIMAKLGAFSPVASVSESQLLMLKHDMISESDFSSTFGFMPGGLEWVISTYAAPHNIRERYNFYRKKAGRNPRELG